MPMHHDRHLLRYAFAGTSCLPGISMPEITSLFLREPLANCVRWPDFPVHGKGRIAAIAYQIWVYRHFWNKVSDEDLAHDEAY